MEQKEHLREEIFDYSLLGENAKLSIEKGLTEASWYTSPVSREKMRELLNEFMHYSKTELVQQLDMELAELLVETL